MLPETLSMIELGSSSKGDVLGVARVAGIQGAKKCPDLIPLCHPLPLNGVAINFVIDSDLNRIKIEAVCKVSAKTGVSSEENTLHDTATSSSGTRAAKAHRVAFIDR